MEENSKKVLVLCKDCIFVGNPSYAECTHPELVTNETCCVTGKVYVYNATCEIRNNKFNCLRFKSNVSCIERCSTCKRQRLHIGELLSQPSTCKLNGEYCHSIVDCSEYIEKVSLFERIVRSLGGKAQY